VLSYVSPVQICLYTAFPQCGQWDTVLSSLRGLTVELEISSSLFKSVVSVVIVLPSQLLFWHHHVGGSDAPVGLQIKRSMVLADFNQLFHGYPQLRSNLFKLV